MHLFCVLKIHSFHCGMNLPVTRIYHNTCYRYPLNPYLRDCGSEAPFRTYYGPKTAQNCADEFCRGRYARHPAAGGAPIQILRHGQERAKAQHSAKITPFRHRNTTRMRNRSKCVKMRQIPRTLFAPPRQSSCAFGHSANLSQKTPI